MSKSKIGKSNAYWKLEISYNFKDLANSYIECIYKNFVRDIIFKHYFLKIRNREHLSKTLKFFLDINSSFDRLLANPNSIRAKVVNSFICNISFNNSVLKIMLYSDFYSLNTEDVYKRMFFFSLLFLVYTNFVDDIELLIIISIQISLFCYFMEVII